MNPPIDAGALAHVLEKKSESADLDFKSGFDPKKPGDWIALVKDIIAFANSGGGTILIGLNDDGSPSGEDVGAALATDPADFANQIHKYTGIHYQGLGIEECDKAGAKICALSVQAAHMPIVFSRVGTFETAPGKQKTEFSIGTVYFRHGAKSEPGTTDDLRAALERELEIVRRSWLDGIAKVTEAPRGARIQVLPPETEQQREQGAGIPSLRLTNDLSAPAHYVISIDTTHPFRSTEVVREVNARLAPLKKITAHDVLCVRRVFNSEDNIQLCYKQKFSSLRYSQAFVDWVVESFKGDDQFFAKAKHSFDTKPR